jgi:hypothetical protein
MRLFSLTMKCCLSTFNTYLCGLALLALAAGCETEKKLESNEKDPKTQMTILRCHMEATPDPIKRTSEVPVFRARPVLLTIDRDCFLNEQNVLSADLVEEPGGFSIRIEFERQGRWLLENFTARNPGRRIVIYAGFGPEQRWLAAWTIQGVIANGKLTFTPDASREEADRIVRGLNNVAKKMDHDPRF